MHKITSLLAALALTACSVHVDSQYGLRLESRRVLAPHDQVAQAESSSSNTLHEPLAQGQPMRSESFIHEAPIDQPNDRYAIDPADMGSSVPQLTESFSQEPAPIDIISQSTDSKLVQQDDTEGFTIRSTSGQIAGLNFLIFLLVLAVIISGLTALVAFSWWIPAYGASVFSGILPLVILIGSFVGIFKLGQKVEALKQQSRSEKTKQNS